ncbi:MAG: SPFH domain-containing protein [Clostridia bacterium]|nr:SPFH domain-containing protein [Clostridia bacterium]
MAHYTMECPKCGSINTPPSGIKQLWQKDIECIHCGEKFNIKQSRMVAKKCPRCGKIVICDQKKLDGKRCPSCGKKLKHAATTEYKGVEIVCPQCSCQIEVDRTKETDVCPVCDKVIDIKEFLNKKEQVNGTGISVIKYEGDNDTFVWKHPIEDFNLGSQLIVHESQEAIFFLNGQALDLFGPGRYTLETQNLPVLKKIYDLPTDKQNPFHAEVYFINQTVQMGIKWGTAERVRFIDPETKIPLDIGAYGELNLQVKNSRKLLVKLVGTTGGIAWDKKGDDFTKSISECFRPLISTAVKTNLASAIKAQQINILEVDEHLEDLSLALRESISEGFEEYGLFVPQLYINNVSLPTDENFTRVKQWYVDKDFTLREAAVQAEVVAAKGKAEIEAEKLKAEKEIIASQAKAAAVRLEGLAEADVMAAKGYSQKDVLQAEVQKAYAEGIGNMGGEGGTGGGMMSEMLGLGVGLAAMGNIGEQVGNAMRGMNGQTEVATTTSVQTGWKCSCGAEGNTGKFCSECGKPKAEPWTCSCGQENTGKFCSECGKAKPEAWTCSCGAVNSGKFCSECGKKMEDN